MNSKTICVAVLTEKSMLHCLSAVVSNGTGKLCTLQALGCGYRTNSEIGGMGLGQDNRKTTLAKRSDVHVDVHVIASVGSLHVSYILPGFIRYQYTHASIAVGRDGLQDDLTALGVQRSGRGNTYLNEIGRVADGDAVLVSLKQHLFYVSDRLPEQLGPNA